MKMQISTVNNSASDKINGIIEEYKVASGGNINAGDFVSFVKEYNARNLAVKDYRPQNKEKTPYNLLTMELSKKHILVYYAIKDFSDNYSFYGFLCTMTENSIVTGEVFNIADNVYSTSYCFLAHKISDTKVCFVYRKSSTYNIYMNVIEIKENEINVGIECLIYQNSSSDIANNYNIVNISTNKVALFFTIGYTIKNILIDISEDLLISVGQADNIQTFKASPSYKLQYITDSQILLLSFSNSDTLYGQLYEIKNEVLNSGVATKLLDTYLVNLIYKIEILNDGRIFIATFYRWTSGCYLYSLILTGNDLELSAFYEKVSFSASYTVRNFYELSKNSFFIILSNSDYICGCKAEINEETITFTQEYIAALYSDDIQYLSSIQLCDNRIVILYHASDDLTVATVNISTKINVEKKEIISYFNSISVPYVKKINDNIMLILLSATRNGENSYEALIYDTDKKEILCRCVLMTKTQNNSNIVILQVTDDKILACDFSSSIPLKNIIAFNYSENGITDVKKFSTIPAANNKKAYHKLFFCKNNKILIIELVADTNDYNIYISSIEEERTVKKKSQVSSISGISKSNGKEGQLIKIIVPNEKEEI